MLQAKTVKASEFPDLRGSFEKVGRTRKTHKRKEKSSSCRSESQSVCTKLAILLLSPQRDPIESRTSTAISR